MQPHILPLKTVRNPRDLGGYITKDGLKVKTGRLLRTGRICKLSDHDANFLTQYGLNKIIDLRSQKERQADPDSQISHALHYDISISPEDNTQAGKSFEEMFELYKDNQNAAFRHMCETYQLMITREHSQHAFHQILELLANNESGATLFHCSEGKDRTGMTTFFILYILGVDLETIRQDYLYSNYMLNDYRARRDQEAREKGESLIFRANLRSLGSVANEYLDSALITIEEKYGELDSYIENQLKVSSAMKQRLRDVYLEK